MGLKAEIDGMETINQPQGTSGRNPRVSFKAIFQVEGKIKSQLHLRD